MDLLEALKLKYQASLDVVKEKGVVLAHLHVDDNWASEVTCDLSIDTSLPQPVRTYTVVGGDSLWKIAAHFYGNGSQFPKIIEGNPDSLVDEKSVIHPGDVLVIPD